MADYPVRKETGKYWSVTSDEGSDKFRRGMEALKAIRREFFSDGQWEKTFDLSMKYKFQDKIENYLRNPGRYRNDAEYIRVKTALSQAARSSGEKTDAIEEAALMALGVMKRRRGSVKQIEKMGENRRETRREARDITTHWETDEDEPVPRPRTPPRTPRPPPVTPSPTPIPPSPIPPTSTSSGGEWFVLTVNVTPQKGGRTSPRDGEAHSYKPGTRIMVQQKANPGFTFHHWDVDGVPVSGPVLRLLMDENHTVFAVFEGASSKCDLQVITLTEFRTPIPGVPVQLDSSFQNTNSRGSTTFSNVSPGSHQVEVPDKILSGGQIYEFDQWADTPYETEIRNIKLLRSASLIAIYKLPGGGAGTTPVKKKKKFTCPTDVLKVARMICRKMPQASYEIIKPIYRKHELIDTYIRQGKMTEQQAYSCLWQVYKEEYEGNIGATGQGIKGSNPAGVLSRTFRQGWRKVPFSPLSYQVPKRGLFDSNNLTPKAKIYRDPLLRSAINRGKRILRQYAKDFYVQRIQNIKKRIQAAKTETDKLKKAYQDEVKKFDTWINAVMKGSKINTNSLLGTDASNQMDALNKILAQLNAGRNPAIAIKAQELANDIERAYSKWSDAKKTLEAMEKEADPKGFSTEITKYLTEAAEGLVPKLIAGIAQGTGQEYWSYRQFAADNIQGELEKEAQYLARYYGNRAQSYILKHLPRASLLLRSASMNTQTGGEAWIQFWTNLWHFILGPWTLSTLFAFIQFMFILTYIGYNVQLLWVFPAIAALFTWILNFSDLMRPFDWVTHLSSGAIIGYGSAMLLVALGAPAWSIIGGFNTIGFWIAWIILCSIALFQFYQVSGFKVILQGGIIILLFSYLALGPYQAYFHSAVDQVRVPVEVAYTAVKGAVQDVWMLATNPTEWYARQQVTNVKGEQPLSAPKGVEITSLDALPPSVPGGQQFAITTVIRNDGSMAAHDVVLSMGCNAWCTSTSAAVTSPADYASARARLDRTTIQALDSGTAFYINENMTRKEGQAITIQPLVARYFTKSPSQTNFAKVTLNLSYAYSTNASLQVDIINENELQKRFREGDTVFKNVVAVDKATPARLALNVGPQPLKAGTGETLLLVSVFASNSENKGRVILQRGAHIIIKMPTAIGHDLYCGGTRSSSDGDYETVDYVVEPSSPMQDSVEILPYQFKSIYAFICKFTTTEDVETIKSGIITAELPRYIYKVTKEKEVVITPALGILFEPWEEVCDRCGGGKSTIERMTSVCQPEQCHALTKKTTGAIDPSTTCYYEYAGSFITQAGNAPTACSVCGTLQPDETDKCEKFKNNRTCTEESERCGWTCSWDKTYVDPVNHVPIGICRGIGAAGACGLTDTTSVPQSTIVDYVNSRVPSDSILVGHGAELYESAVRNHINPAFLLALAIHEGASGTSAVAKCKLNSFGWGATDACTNQCSDAPGCAKRFDTVQQSFDVVAAGVYEGWLSSSPRNPPQRKTLAEMSGRTATGNVYATDNAWPGAMATLMSRITGKTCSATVSVTPASTSTSTTATAKGEANYCKNLYEKTGGLCDMGWGGCDTGTCDSSKSYDLNGNGIFAPLTCRSVSGKNICCTDASDSTDEQCTNAHNAWMVAMYGVYSASVSATNYLTTEKYNEILRAAPARATGSSVEYIVLHHSGKDSTGESSLLSVFDANLATKNNEHYIVDKDGSVVSVIPEQFSAQHANCLNSRSIGIEIVNTGEGETYPEAQLAGLRLLVSDLINRYGIQAGHVIGHGCTNPGKKADEPTGLDPYFLSDWTVIKREGSTPTCDNLCV